MSGFKGAHALSFQWKLRSEEKTVVGGLVDNTDLVLLPILRKRVDEEEGPTAVDDLEAHAAGRRTPEPVPPAPIPPPSSGQSYANKKRAKRRKAHFQENGRQTKIKKLEEHVQLCQTPALVDDFDAKTLPAASGASSSLRLRENVAVRKRNPEIEDLLAQGFRYIAAEDAGDHIK